MPAASRFGPDGSTGHDGFKPRPSASAGSPDVFINGSPALRVGDAWPEHYKGSAHHPATQSAGSGTVFVNGQALARIGDSLSDGDALAGGSPDVISG